MNIVLFGKNRKRTGTTQFIVDAFKRAGHDVLWINFSRWRRFVGNTLSKKLVSGRIRKFHPDYAFLISKDCPAELVQEFSEYCVVSIFCAMYRDEPDPGVLERAKIADILFLANEGQLGLYRDAGARNPTYLPQACDDYGHRPVDSVSERYRSEVAFVGKPDDDRIPFLKSIAEEFDTKVWGPGWKGTGLSHGMDNVTAEEFAKICCGASIVLGADRPRGVRLCFSNRLWITLGCRGFLITNYVPGFEEMFENGRHLVWYESEDECKSLIRSYLKKDEDRKRIAEEGYRLAHGEHTYDHFVKKVLDVVGECSRP